MTTKIAVFASGSGSNFQAIQEAIERGELHASVELVVTDKPGAFVVTRAKNFGIAVLEFAPKTFESKAAYEEEIVAELHAKRCGMGCTSRLYAFSWRNVTKCLSKPYC